MLKAYTKVSTRMVNVLKLHSTTACLHMILASTLQKLEKLCSLFEQSRQWLIPPLPKMCDDCWIHRNAQADIFIDVCTFSIVAAAPEQTLILNSPRRRLGIDPFLCRLDLLPSTNLANVSLSADRKRLCVLRKKKEKKAHRRWRQCFFCLWFSTLIEFFNNAQPKRREGSLLPLNSASLLDLQGINILERMGRSPLRGRGKKTLSGSSCL